jgi:SAM-dependent methyltransferase
VVVVAFVLFHVPQPDAALNEVRRVLRPGGHVGVTTWGFEETTAADKVWREELERGGVAPAVPLVNHDLADTADKLSMLLADAGFRDSSVVSLPWSYRPSRDQHIARATQLGVTARRLNGMEPDVRAEVLRRVDTRLAALSEDGFVERGEVLAATAIAP